MVLTTEVIRDESIEEDVLLEPSTEPNAALINALSIDEDDVDPSDGLLIAGIVAAVSVEEVTFAVPFVIPLD